MVTNVEINARPVTQQGMSGMKTAGQGPGRQVADKSFFLNTLRVKIQEISSEMNKLQGEIDQKQREGNEYAHLQRRFEQARRKAAERQTTLQDYNFAKEKKDMDMEDMQQASKQIGEVCDFRRKQVDDIFKERKSKEAEIRALDSQNGDLRQQALQRLEKLGPDKVDQYKRLDAENKDALQTAEQLRRQLTDLTLAVNSKEDELKQDPLRKKGAQLTADKKMYEEQLRDLNEQEDDESLPYEEAKKRLLKRIADDNVQIQEMENQKSQVSNQIKDMKIKLEQVESNLDASKGGKSEKHKELQARDAEMTKYLDEYPEQRKKNVEAVLQSEKNVVTLLRHVSSEISRKTNLPSQADVGQLKSDLEFKQGQFENAETTLQRVNLELNERKQDLERVEELERKMNQEMDNLNDKMQEMRDEINVFENIGDLRKRASNEIAVYENRIMMLTQRKKALEKAKEEQKADHDKRKKTVKEIEAEKELENLEKRLQAMEENLFGLREFVFERNAQTNVAPLRDEVQGLGFEINNMLISMQQKAA